MTITQPPGPAPSPPGWGDDDFTQFLDLARQNQFATFHNMKPRYNDLAAIDGCFYRAGAHMLNPKDAISPLIFYRCHSAFRAACGTSMAGQVPETFVLLRSCLEYAAYGIAMFTDVSLATVWLDRHVDAKTKKASVQEFQITKIREMIDRVDKGLTPVFQGLYDRAIDFGAHPNERAATSAASITEDKDQVRIM